MDFIALRHALHKIPEIAFGELSTKALLLNTLKQIKGICDPEWKIHEFTTNTGILVIYQATDEAYKLFRADMDALPVQENTASQFSSQHPGFMHACGHDVHMAILMGLIAQIAEQKPARNLMFLFQPAEEGKGGAQSVLAEGIIQSYPVSSAFALHVASGLPVGSISSKAGIFFGIPQEFDVRFIGKASHVAYPEQGINALHAGRDFLACMDEAIAELAKTERVIYHVGKMSAGDIRNIIPALCTLEGTHRSLKSDVRDTMNKLTAELAHRSAEKFSAEAEVEFLCSYDAVVNDTALTDKLRSACNQLGLDYREAETAMTGEDFGFFTTLYPGLLFWLGSGCSHPLHSDKFLPQDESLSIGIKLLTHLALS